MIDPSLPLIDLHRHLDGAVRLETILDLGAQHNLPLPSWDVEGLRPHVQVTGATESGGTMPGVMAFISKFKWMTEILVDLDACRAAGVSVVRRPTGGRAILHAEELTYAVVGTSPGPLFGASLHETYMRINEALLEFLRGLGIDADISEGESREEMRGLVCFKSAGRHEVSVAGRKIIGSPQRRCGDVCLQHGSILAGPRHLDLLNFLGGGGRASLAAATTDLGRLLDRPMGPAELDDLAEPLAEAFGRCLAVPLDYPKGRPGA